MKTNKYGQPAHRTDAGRSYYRVYVDDTPKQIDAREQEALARLRAEAARNPVNVGQAALGGTLAQVKNTLSNYADGYCTCKLCPCCGKPVKQPFTGGGC